MKFAKTLRWVWDGKTGISATIQTFVTQILILGVTLFTGIMTARFLGPEGRGEQAAILLWPEFLGYAFALGIGPALLFHLRDSPEEKSELFSAALTLGAVFGAIATFVGIIFIPQWLDQYSNSTIRVAQLFMLTAPLSLLSLILLNSYRAQHDFSTVNKTNYLMPFATLVLLVALGGVGLFTPIGSSLAYRIPVVVITLWRLREQWNYYRPNFKKFRVSCRKILSYSTRSAGINILNQVAARVDQAMVISLLSPSSMGIYIVSLNLSRMVEPFNRSILSVLFPKMAARPPKEVMVLTGRAARISGFSTALAVVVAAIVAPFVLTGLYGAEFSQGVNAFRVLALRMVFEGVTMVLAQAFMALDKPGTVAILQGVGLGSTIPLMLLLIPPLGLVGASYALLISTVIRLIFIMICFPILLKLPMPNLFIKTHDLVFIKNSMLSR